MKIFTSNQKNLKQFECSLPPIEANEFGKKKFYSFKKFLLAALLILMSSAGWAQSFRTPTFSGATGDFTAAEKYGSVDAVDYYVTYDATYIYFGAFRNSSATWGQFDHFTVYVDNVGAGTGSATGINWDGNTPTLPFNADYRIAIRRNASGESFYSNWNGSSWTTGGTNGQGYTQFATASANGALEVRVPWSDFGSPNAIRFFMYASYNTGYFGYAPNGSSGGGPTGSTQWFGSIGTKSADCVPTNTTNLSLTAATLTNSVPAAAGTYARLIVNSGTVTNANSWTLAPGGIIEVSGSATFAVGAQTITMGNAATSNGRGTTINTSGSGSLTTTSSSIFDFGGEGNVTGNALTMSGAIRIRNKFVPLASGNLTFASGSNLDIRNGGFVSTNAPTYASGSTLMYNSGGNYGVSTEWTAGATSGAGYPSNVQISNNIASSGLNFGASNTAYSMRGNMNLASTTATLALSTGTGGLNIGGDWTRNASATFTTNNKTVTFNGTAAQTINSATTFYGLTIANTTANVTAAAALTIAPGGTMTINSSARFDLGVNNLTLTTATCNVNGFLRIGGASNPTFTGVSATTLNFNNGGTYEHNYTGAPTTASGVIPTATWNAGSTCKIINMATTSFTGPMTVANGWGQTFSNFEWACANQAATINWQMNATTPPTINGTFTVSNTNAQILRLASSGSYTLAVGGLAVATNTAGNATLNLNNGSTAIINCTGNFSMSQSSGTATLSSSAGTSTINFSHATATQTWSQSAGTISGTIAMNVGTGATTNTLQLLTNAALGTGTGVFTVANGSSMDFQTFVLSGSGSFTAATGSTLVSGNLSGTGAFQTSTANGSVQTTTRTFTNAGVNYTFNGASAQFTGNAIGAASNIRNLTFNTTGTLTLSSAATLSATGVLAFGTNATTFILGANDLTLTSGATISGAGSTKYVRTASTGQLKRTALTTAFTFPVGNSAYNPITLTNTGASDTYGIIASDGTVPNALDATLAVNRYWAVTEGTGGGGNLAVTAQFNTADGAGASYSTATNPQYIGLYPNASPWTQVSSGAAASGSNPFTVTASGFTTSLPTSGSTYYFAVGTSGAFVAPAVAPTITSFSVALPGSGSSGYVGNTITVIGTGFLASGMTVKIGGSGGTTVSYGFTNSTTITITAINLSGTIYIDNGTAPAATSVTSYTNLGYITITGATNWNAAASWVGGAVPAAGSKVTIAHALSIAAAFTFTPISSITVNPGITATASATVAIGTVTGSITTVGTGVFTFSGAGGSIIAGSVVNAGTLSWSANSNLNISAFGTLTNNGTFTRGTGTVTIANAATINGLNAITFNDLTITAGTATLTTVPTIDGTLTITSGGVSAPPIYTTNSTLNYNGVSVRSTEWNATGVGTIGTTAGYPNNVTINTGTVDIVNGSNTARALNGTLTVNTGATFNVNALNAALTIGGGLTTVGTGAFSMGSTNAGVAVAGTLTNAGTVTLSTATASLTVSGAVSNSGALTLSSNIGGDIYVTGNFINNGTFTHSSRALFLNGITQTLGGSNINGSGTTNCFPFLILQNGTNVTLSASAAVTNTLTLTSGKITLSTFDLNMGASAISGASSSNYIVTNSTGQLKSIVAGTAILFPVGNTVFNPITLTNAGTSDTYGIRVTNGAPTNAGVAAKTIQRSWFVTEGTAGGSNLTPVVGQYNTGEEGASFAAGTTPYIGLYNGTSWTQVATTLGGSNPFTATSTGANQFPVTIPSGSYFAIGKDDGLTTPLPTITASGGVVASTPGSGTSGYVGNTITINGTNLNYITVVKVGGSGGTSVTITGQTSTTLTFVAINLSGQIYVENAVGGNATSTETYTNLGYITTTTGGWSTAGTWLGAAVPTSATTTNITIAHNVTSTSGTTDVGSLTVNASTTLTITASTIVNINTASTNSGTITNNGTLTTAVTYTNSGTITVNGTFQINQGGFASGGTWTYGASGTLVYNNTSGPYGSIDAGHSYWPSSSGPVNVTVQGGGGINMGVSRTVSGTFLLVTGTNAVQGTALTLNGTTQINGGNFQTTPTYGSASTLIYNTGYGISNEWTGNSLTPGSGIPFNVTILSGTLTFPASNRGIGGNFNITSGGATLNGTSGDLYVGGNFTNNGTFTHNTRAVFLNGTSQTVSGSNLNTSGVTNCFDYLILQNGTIVTLGASVAVRTNLTFTSGKITLGINDLNLGTASITTPTSSSFVVTNGGGQLKRTVTTSAILFPVGNTNTTYNPITLTNAGTSDIYGINSVNGAPANANAPLVTVQRSWYVTEANAGGSDLTPVVAQYNTGEEGANFNAGVTSYMGLYNGTSWTQVATTLAGSNPYTATSTGTAQFPATIPAGSYIAIGKDLGLTTTPPTISSFTSTSGYSGSSIVITGTNFLGATAVSFGGTAAASFTVNSATQITAVVGTGGTSGSVSVTTPSGSTSLAGFTYLGFITTVGATTWNTGASWLGGAVPTANNAVTVAHNLSINAAFTNSPVTSVTVNTGITATASHTGAIGTITNAITTVGTGTFTFSGAGSIIVGSVVNGGTLSWSAAATLNINAGGTLTNNGTFTRGTGTVNFVGSAGTVNGSNAITFNNLTNNSGALTLTTIPNIDGTLQLNGGFVSAAPIYTSNSTLYYNLSYNRSNEWNATGVGTIGTTAGYPNNVTINTGTFDIVNGSNTARAMNGTLTVNTGATFNVNALNAAITIGGGLSTVGTGAFNMGTTNGAVTVAGAVTNAGSLTLSSAFGGDIYVAGNFTNNGTFTHNTRAVFLNGTTQTVSGSALNTSGATNCFDFLFIQNNSQVTLGAAVTVRSNLTFTSGDIILSTFNLTLSSGSTITGASSANYVITNSTGLLVRTLATSTAVTFPIGNSAYNPITLSQSGASDVYSLRMIDGSLSGLTPNDVTRTINRRWSFSRTSSTNVNITVSSISYNTGEENNATNFNGGTQPYYGLYNGTLWVHAIATQAAQTFTSANTVASSTATSFSVAMGKDIAFLPPAPTVTSFTSTPNNGSSTSGYSGSTVTITGTDFTGATVVSFGGSAAASFIVNSATQITAVVGTGGATGNVSVTTPSGSGLLAGFTYLGFITTTGATTWNTAASWLGGAVPTANTAVTIAHNLSINAAFTNSPLTSITVNTGITATASAAIAIGTVTNAITTVGTGTFTFSGAGSIIAGSFVNGGTLSWSAAATLNISASGTLTNNGTFTAGTGTVNFVGAGTLNGSAAVTFNNVSLNGGLTLTTVPTVNGSLQLNAGAFVSAAPNYGSSSTLIYNTGGTYVASLEWTANALSGTGIPQNVTIGNGVNTTLSFGAATQYRQLLGNLVINASSGLTLSTAFGGDLNVAGDFTNNGTFTHNTRALLLNGTIAQALAGTLNASGATNCLAFLFITNTSGTVSSAVSINVGTSGSSSFTQAASGTYVQSAGTFTLVTGALGTINGTFRNTAAAGSLSIATSNNMTVSGTGTYEHARSGGTIPLCTWGTASLCYITGATSSAPSGLNQSFSDFTWDCASQSSSFSFSGNLTSARNVTFSNTEGNTIGLVATTAMTATYESLTISNNSLVTLVTGANTNNVSLTISNNASIEGSGSLTVSSGSGTGTVLMTVNGSLSNTSSSTSSLIVNSGNKTSVNLSIINGYMQDNTGSVSIVQGTGAGTMTVTSGDFTLTNGNFYMNTGSGTAILNQNNASNNFNLNGGQFNFIQSGTAPSTHPIINISGNFIQSGSANIEFSNVGGSLNPAGEIFVAKDFTRTGTGYIANSAQANNARITFNGTTQTYTSTTSGSFSFTDITINAGSTVTLASNIKLDNTLTPAQIVTVSGSLICGTNLVIDPLPITTATAFILNATGTLSMGSLQGITASGATGNIQVGTRTFNAGTYVYTGANNQVTGNGLPGTVAALTIANTGTTPNNVVTLTNTVTSTGALTFTSGMLTIGANNITVGSISGASSTQYVRTASTGRLRQTVGGIVAFPVGNSVYNPIIFNNTGTSDVLAVAAADAITLPLNNSNKVVNRSWTVTEGTAGGSNISVVAQWNGSGEEAAGFNGGTTNLIGVWTGSAWTQVGANQAGTNPYTFTSTSNFLPAILTPASYTIAIGKDDAFNCPTPPTITSLSASNGYTGDVITLTGTGLTALTTATIGGTAATIGAQTGTTAAITITTGATGNIIVATSPVCSSTPFASFTYNGYISAQTGNWNTGSTWRGGGVPLTGRAVTIANTHTVTLDVNATPLALTINAGGTYQQSNNTNTMNVASTTNNGTITLGAALTSSARFTSTTLNLESGSTFNNNCGNAQAVSVSTFNVKSSSTYNHNSVGSSANGAIADFPGLTGGSNITINSNATINITKWAQTGNPTNLPTVVGGQWGNLTINITGQTYSGSWQNSGSITNATTLNIQNTGGRDFRLIGVNNTFTGTFGTVNVSGGIFAPFAGGSTGGGTLILNITDLNISGGTMSLQGSAGSSANNTTSITSNIAGNLMMTGGTLYGIASNSTTGTYGSSTTTLNVNGNTSVTSATLDMSYLPLYVAPSTATGAVVFNLKGDLTIGTGGTFRSSNSINTGRATASSVNLNHATATQTLSQTGTISDIITWNVNGGGNTVQLASAANIGTSITASLNVASGATLDFSTNILSGSGTFTANSGSTLKLGNAGGIATSGASGNVQVSGTRTYNAGANYTYNGSSNQATGTGLPTTHTGTLTIANPGNTVTLTTSGSTGASLVLTSGIFEIGNGGAYSFSSGGTVTATGGDFATVPNGGTIIFNGAGTFTGTTNPYNVYVSGGVNFGSSTTIQSGGTFRIDNGGFANTNGPSYASGSILQYNTGGNYGRGAEWSATSGAGYPANVQISGGTTLNLGNGGTGTARACAGNLTIDDGSILSMNETGSIMTAALTVNGDITIGNIGAATLTLSGSFGGDLNVKGNWTRNATSTFNHNSRRVTFNGTSAQTSTGHTTFGFVTLNNSNGMTLNNPWVIANELNLTSGKITIGANDLTVNSGATLLNATTSKYIVTNGNGKLIQQLQNNNTAVAYPVGTASSYAPATLTQSGTGATDNVGVSVAVAPTFSPNVGGNVTEMVNLQWKINEASAGGNDINTKFQWNLSDEGTGGSPNFNRAGTVYHGDYNGADYTIRNTTATTTPAPYTSTSSVNFTSNLNDRTFVVGNLNGIKPCYTTQANGDWVTDAATVWASSGGVVPPVGANICIGHNLTINTGGSNNVAALNISAGSFTIGSGQTLTIASGGSMANSSGSQKDLTDGTVVFAGTAAVSGASGITFKNLTLNGATTFTTSPTITGTLTMNPSSSVPSGSPIYSSTSTLYYPLTSNFLRTGEWGASGVGTIGSTPGYPNNVTLTALNNFILNLGGATPSVSRACYGNLLLDQYSVMTMNAGGSQMTAPLVVRGNITIGAGSVPGRLELSGLIGGDVYCGGDFNAANGNGTECFTANGRAVFLNGSGTQNLYNASSLSGVNRFAYLIIDKPAGTAKLNYSTTMTAATGDVLQILNNGTFDLNGRSLTLSGAGGNILVNGGARSIITTGGASNFDITGTKTVTGTGTLTFGSNVSVNLSTGMNFGNNLSTIGGTLRINAGGSIVNFPPTYTSASTLNYNTGGAYNRSLEWSALSGAGYPWNVTLSNSTNLDLGANLGAAIAREIAGNLTVNDGSTLSMATTAMSQPLTVKGNVTIGAGTSGILELSGTFGGDLNIGGNLTLNASATFTHNDREITFNGASAQAIGGTIASYPTINYLQINNTSGGITLNKPLTINTRLTLTNGAINNTANGITMASGSKIIRNLSLATLSAPPIITTNYDLEYNSTMTTGNEFTSTNSEVRDVTITAGDVTLNASRTFNRDLILSGGDLILGGFTMTARGQGTTSTFSGSITVSGGGTRNVKGTGNFDITGLGANLPLNYTKTVSTFGGTSLSFGSGVTVRIGDGAVDFGAGNPTTVNGVLQIILGGSVGQSLNPCNYGTNSILRFANTVDYQVSAADKTWASGSINSGNPGIPYNVEVNTSGTDLTMQDLRALRGNLTITDGTITFTNTFAGAFNIGGDWSRSGASSSFNDNRTSANKKVIFNRQSSGNQTITVGTGLTNETFTNLEVKLLTNTDKLILGASTNIAVINDLTFTSGKIDLGTATNNFTIGTSGTNGTITGAGINNYFITDYAGAGALKLNANTNTTYTFPVGDASNYTPINLTLNSGANSSAILSGKVVDGQQPQLASVTPTPPSDYLTRYWSMDETGLTAGFSYGIDATYVNTVADVTGNASMIYPYKYHAGSGIGSGWVAAAIANSAYPMGTGSVSGGHIVWNGLNSFSDITGGGNGTPQPITLLSFDAKPNEGKVDVTWNTASEINNDYFVVERSKNGSDFEKVSTIKGAGNHNGILNYSSVDANPYNGVSYYRLKQVDFNGAFSYSDIKAVSIDKVAESNFSISLYPNPSNGEKVRLTISNLPSNTTVSYQITNMLGNQITESKAQLISNNTFTDLIETRSFAEGVYFVTINIDGKLVSRKLVIKK